MQQINVIVTPKAKQTISVTVNGVAMSVVNSDGSYSTTHYNGTPFIIPDTIIKNTEGATILTQPSATSTGVIADSVVSNSDDSYVQNVPAETNLEIPDSTIYNSIGTVLNNLPATKQFVVPNSKITDSGGTQIFSVPATITYPVADSVVSNSDSSYVRNVKATKPLALTDITVYSKDANGQIIATPYPAAKDYTEAGSIPDANGWIRPPDWLPISHLVTDGEEKAVALYAVWDAAGIANGYNNYCALYVTGNYTVDWGDGTVENFASGVQAEHEYIYANLPASSYCSRGYRQAIITITPQAGQHLTLINYSRKHTLNTSVYCTNGILDVYLSGTDIGRVMFYDSTYSQCKLLEKFYGYQVTNKLTNMYYMFYNCYSLQTLDLSSFNTAAVTTMSYMFYNCTSLRGINLAHTSLLNVTDNTNITNSTGQLLICRLPLIAKTFTVANNKLTATELNALFGDLKDLTALAAQTITVTGNPGAATCNPAIATAKNWIVVT